MTDMMFTRTALTEAAKKAGVATDQARTILEAAGVKVEPEKPALPTEPGSDIIATEVRGVTGKWRAFLDPNGYWITSGRIGLYTWHHADHITAWTETVVAPAGKKIDPDDVREGDRVRLELDGGDEVTITVTGVNVAWVESRYSAYARNAIRTIHLLNREGEG